MPITDMEFERGEKAPLLVFDKRGQVIAVWPDEKIADRVKVDDITSWKKELGKRPFCVEV